MKTHYLPKNFNNQHYQDIIHEKFYRDLILFRNELKLIIDDFFLNKIKAINIDLFMMTNSISSPMGSGSDSLPIKFKFGKQYTFLTDSAQFGFEPIIMTGLNKVYCYLPSLRGEDADARHLNQFYHCEYESIGNLKNIITIQEKLMTFIATRLLKKKQLFLQLSRNPRKTETMLNNISSSKNFPQISFDDSITLLRQNKEAGLFIEFENGIDLTAKGETVLAKMLKLECPFWITHYDRDRVPFYQKPQPKKANKVLNADLIAPPLLNDSFGGEIAGSGQRQNNAKEMLSSLKRQKISPKNYQWYINLRKMSNYKTTAGFGLGIERLITWLLGFDNIKYATVYPRIKDLKITP